MIKWKVIHKQKYYALFLMDMQQWFEYRRTGHPVLPKGAGLKNGGVMPAKMTYPVYVQSTNPTNYKLGSCQIGGRSDLYPGLVAKTIIDIQYQNTVMKKIFIYFFLFVLTDFPLGM